MTATAASQAVRREPLPERHPLAGAHDVRVRPLRPDEATNGDAALDLITVVEPNGDRSAGALAQLFASEREGLLRELRESGCVLFRGFDVDRQSFEHIVSQGFRADRYVWMFPLPPSWARVLLRLPLSGWLTRKLLGFIESRATGRKIVEKKLSTLANDQTIQFPHHEYGIFFNVPQVLAFLCEKEAEREGETMICDARAGYRAMDPAVRDKFESARYIRYRDENQRYMPAFRAPAVLRHPVDGHPSMNFTAYHHDVAAGVAREMFPESSIVTDELDETFTFNPTFVHRDGSQFTLDEKDVEDVARAHFAHSVLLPWREGDLLLMDNYRVVHGRLNAGEPRKVLQVMLCDYVRNRL